MFSLSLFLNRCSSSYGEGNGNPLQYTCLGNPKDRGAPRAAVRGVARSGHDWVTKPPPPPLHTVKYNFAGNASSQGSLGNAGLNKQAVGCGRASSML